MEASVEEWKSMTAQQLMDKKDSIEEEIKSDKEKGVTKVSIQFLRQNLGLER